MSSVTRFFCGVGYLVGVAMWMLAVFMFYLAMTNIISSTESGFSGMSYLDIIASMIVSFGAATVGTLCLGFTAVVVAIYGARETPEL